MPASRVNRAVMGRKRMPGAVAFPTGTFKKLTTGIRLVLEMPLRIARIGLPSSSSPFLPKILFALSMMSLFKLLFAAFLLSHVSLAAETSDVLVYGASPAGITAAIAAAREKLTVTIVEPTHWIGGMTAGGLSSSDVGNPDTIGGLSQEFFTRCGTHYDGKEKYHCEPHIYQQVFAEMLKEAGVKVVTGQRLTQVAKAGAKITAFTTQDGREWQARVFIDATYEGDLMAKAGVSYIVGRESREAYDEPLAGVYRETPRGFGLDVMTTGCPCVGDKGPHYVHGVPDVMPARGADGKLMWGITESNAPAGSADKLTQSYNFRLCVTNKAENLVPWPKPLHYDPKRYDLLLELVRHYPGIRFSRIVHLGKLINDKYDLNAQGIFSTDYVGGNFDYPDGDEATRARIWQDHIDYVQGLCWFLANDTRVPDALRQETQSWGLCRDEFTDNAHWPYALYVREARRMIGSYVMTQQDVQKDVVKADGIGMGSFIIDSHIVRRLVDAEGHVIDEGAFDAPTRPYQIPYGTLTPKRAECENLLVPVCCSATHIAYGTLRMEPVYMSMGHASGLAAALSLKTGKPVQDVDVKELRKKLLDQKQVLELAPSKVNGVAASSLKGIVVDDDDATFTGSWITSNFGVSVGGNYHHDGNAGKGTKTATFRIKVPTSGKYEVRMSYATATNRATNVPVKITSADGEKTVKVNQKVHPSLDQIFVSLGGYSFASDKGVIIEISNEGADGYVVVDAIQLLPADAP